MTVNHHHLFHVYIQLPTNTESLLFGKLLSFIFFQKCQRKLLLFLPETTSGDRFKIKQALWLLVKCLLYSGWHAAPSVELKGCEASYFLCSQQEHWLPVGLTFHLFPRVTEWATRASQKIIRCFCCNKWVWVLPKTRGCWKFKGQTSI